MDPVLLHLQRIGHVYDDSCLYIDECGDCGGNGIAGALFGLQLRRVSMPTCVTTTQTPGCDDLQANYFQWVQ